METEGLVRRPTAAAGAEFRDRVGLDWDAGEHHAARLAGAKVTYRARTGTGSARNDDEQQQQCQRDHDTTEDEPAKGLTVVGVLGHSVVAGASARNSRCAQRAQIRCRSTPSDQYLQPKFFRLGLADGPAAVGAREQRFRLGHDPRVRAGVHLTASPRRG